MCKLLIYLYDAILYVLLSFFFLHSIFYFKTLSTSVDVLVVDISNCYVASRCGPLILPVLLGMISVLPPSPRSSDAGLVC